MNTRTAKNERFLTTEGHVLRELLMLYQGAIRELNFKMSRGGRPKRQQRAFGNVFAHQSALAFHIASRYIRAVE